MQVHRRVPRPTHRGHRRHYFPLDTHPQAHIRTLRFRVEPDPDKRSRQGWVLVVVHDPSLHAEHITAEA